MKEISVYSIRKCSDINLAEPYYEVLDEDDNILFEISIDNSGELSIIFYKNCVETILSVPLLKNILNDIENLFQNDN